MAGHMAWVQMKGFSSVMLHRNLSNLFVMCKDLIPLHSMGFALVPCRIDLDFVLVMVDLRFSSEVARRQDGRNIHILLSDS